MIARIMEKVFQQRTALGVAKYASLTVITDDIALLSQPPALQ